jgi:hypothetical protein
LVGERENAFPRQFFDTDESVAEKRGGEIDRPVGRLIVDQTYVATGCYQISDAAFYVNSLVSGSDYSEHTNHKGSIRISKGRDT